MFKIIRRIIGLAALAIILFLVALGFAYTQYPKDTITTVVNAIGDDSVKSLVEDNISAKLGDNLVSVVHTTNRDESNSVTGFDVDLVTKEPTLNIAYGEDLTELAVGTFAGSKSTFTRTIEQGPATVDVSAAKVSDNYNFKISVKY